MNVLDLFSGAGGMSLGFQRAGFKVIGALEHIPVYCKTHKLNFPECNTVCQDISKLTASAFAKLTNILKQDVDVLIGGPPCQTFSTIGQSKIKSVSNGDVKNDPRNYLFKHFFKYVEFYGPRIFVMENVPNIATKYKGSLFRDILKISKELGYEVKYEVLNAAEYGVPQKRRRLFLVGTKKGVDFSFPVVTHYIDAAVPHGNLLPCPTLRDAIEDLPKIYDGIRENHLKYSKNKELSDYQVSMRNIEGTVTNNVCRVSNDRAKKVFSHMKQGQKYMDLDKSIRKILPFREDIFHDRLKKMVFDEPSWTVIAHIGMDGYMYIHPEEIRTLSVREAARIQSFHDSFEFVGNMREQYIQVGNAVPPLLAEKLARSCRRALSNSSLTKENIYA